MNWLTPGQQQQIKKLACAKHDQETCGFVLTTGAVIEVPNTAADPVNEFAIAPTVYAKHDSQIKGIWHSHLDLAGFSPLDQQVMGQDTLPWAVYCLADSSWHQCDPTTVAPFEGRPFAFGHYDCYSLISDYLRDLGVNLPQWNRGSWGEWNTPLFTPFDDNAKKVGQSIKVGKQQRGDILLLNLGDYPQHTDHVGVFTSSRQFLHHPSGGVSRLQTFGGYWERRLNWIIRPHELCKS